MSLPSERELVEANYARMEARIRELEAALRYMVTVFGNDVFGDGAEGDAVAAARAALAPAQGPQVEEPKLACGECGSNIGWGRNHYPNCSQSDRGTEHG